LVANVEQFTVEIVRVGGEYGPAVSLEWNRRLTDFADLNYYIAILRSESRTVLVNSGLPEYIGNFEEFVKEWHPVCRIDRESSFPDIAPGSVTHVVCTPLTVYTTGNLHLFPNAELLFGRRGWIDFWAPTKHAPKLPLDIAIPERTRQYLAGPALKRVRLLDDEDSICSGVDVFYTGGHHSSSMAIVVNTRKGKVVLADCCFTYVNLEQNVPIGWAENIHEINIAYDRIRRTADIAIPLYDPEVLRRYPGGKVA
jgi:glyoxylase-like metal-dependent hydrolase (beta-lactamase superfamily II)